MIEAAGRRREGGRSGAKRLRRLIRIAGHMAAWCESLAATPLSCLHRYPRRSRGTENSWLRSRMRTGRSAVWPAKAGGFPIPKFSSPPSGGGGRWFKSTHSDHLFQALSRFPLPSRSRYNCPNGQKTPYGTRRDAGLGAFPQIRLLDARQQAYKYRKIARGGGDPVAPVVRRVDGMPIGAVTH